MVKVKFCVHKALLIEASLTKVKNKDKVSRRYKMEASLRVHLKQIKDMVVAN